jgi:ATP-dependent DNA helicase DinG
VSSTVERILGPGGTLEASLETYEPRPEQLAVALAVEKAFEEKSYLLAEAGTGTGKTLAYLVPAVLAGRKVIVSTATKTLQEQIFFKDIPLLRKRVGLKFRAEVLKGRQNYVCLYRLESFTANGRPEEDHDALALIRSWASRTNSGDKAELDLPEQEGLWRELTTTAETCLGAKCPVYENCFVTRARTRAAAADVVVVNHHLFFADLSIRQRAQSEGVLPAYDAVIFDEAHALEGVVSDHFGKQLSSYRIEDLVQDALKALPPEDGRNAMLTTLALALGGRADTLFEKVSRSLALREGGSVRLLPGSLAMISEQVHEVLGRLATLASFAAGAEEPELLALARRSTELADDLELLYEARSEEFVFWAEVRGKGAFLRAAPIDVSRPLQQALYRHVDTVIFTSATLTAGGRFDFFERRMGLKPSPEEGDEGGLEEPLQIRRLSVASPFDFKSQAALYVPKHLPEPNMPGFAEAVAEEVVRLTALSQGRAFVLFTSLRNMHQVHALTKERLGYPVLLQGERPKSVLLDAFIAEPSVLFASHSFWEGVDVPGEALSLVIIDKLPFASPTDPLVAARIDRLQSQGLDPFSAYQLPEAAIALRQGFGRLVRSRTDIGIVAILDRRLTTRAYGRTLLQSLPPAQRIFTPEQLEVWGKERWPENLEAVRERG